MKKKKTNSLLALNYYWHDEKIDSSNDSLCVKKWYFGVQHLNESWVMPLEIFSVQICADEMVLILYKNTSGSARSMSTSSSAILMFCGFCLVKPACLAWGFSCKTSSWSSPTQKRLTSRWKPRKVEAWVSTERGLCWKEWPAELRRPHGGRPTSPTGRWRCLCSYSCARSYGRKTDWKSILYWEIPPTAFT